MLCMHDQGGGMHSKPNLHGPQQGENERERKSKEREISQEYLMTFQCYVWETVCCLEMSHWVLTCYRNWSCILQWEVLLLGFSVFTRIDLSGIWHCCDMTEICESFPEAVLSTVEMLCYVHHLSRKDKKIPHFKLPIALPNPQWQFALSSSSHCPGQGRRNMDCLAGSKSRGQRCHFIDLWAGLISINWSNVPIILSHLRSSEVKAPSHNVKCSENAHPSSAQCCRNRAILCMSLSGNKYPILFRVEYKYLYLYRYLYLYK